MKIKKMFAKFLATTMAVGMLVGMSGAANNGAHNFDFGNKEIAICGSVDYSKAQSIANTINGEVGIAPMGIFCLLGHNLAQTTGVEIEHRFWTNPTRCRRTTYRIDYCTNWLCNYSVGTVISQVAIVCCP